MPPLLTDFRHAARVLRRNRAFAVTAIAVLATGIGATTAIFSVVNKVLLEPLPYPDAQRLVQLRTVAQLGNQSVVSIPKYVIWRDHTHVFDSIAAYDISGVSVSLTQSGFAEPLEAARVSAGYFALFGAPVKSGRTFSTREDQPGGPRVAVIGEDLWRARFAADPALVGRSLLLDHESYTVIGVLTHGFTGLNSSGSLVNVWLPLQAAASSTDHVGRVQVVARLKRGVSIEQAQEDVAGKPCSRF